jgi:hypothetical protein
MVDKLNIKPLESPLADKYPDGINVQFNPNSYSIVKRVTWTPQGATPGSPSQTSQTNRDLDAPPLEFGGGERRVLTLQLFFDVTEGVEGSPTPVTDVRTETNKIVALTRIQRDAKPKPQPPVCLVKWGKEEPKGSDFPFRGVVTSLTQNFTLFHSSGCPLRANLTVEFTENIDAEQNKKETDPDFTTYVVKLGDTLSAIAAEVYRDPAKWRVIADANRIDDPRRLTIGDRLAVPKLT